MSEETTHFGFQDVPISQKAEKVRGVFNSVAHKYDVMNDAMSFGVHRMWKRFALRQTGLKPGDIALDCAGGTGDLSLGLAKQVGETGTVVLSDINAEMLSHGREKLENKGWLKPIAYAQLDVEHIPFPDHTFDCVTIGFGLRNVTDKAAGLLEMYRVLKPGGRLLVLEFSKPLLPALGKLYDVYSFNILPKLGEWIAKDRESYQYLAESIRKHPDQETLKEMVLDAGFDHCSYQNMSGGIVSLHTGYKY